MFRKVVLALGIVCALFGSLNAHAIALQPEFEDECPQICNKMYVPICGTDGVNFMEFSNPCVMDASNCRLKRASAKPFAVADLDMCRTELISGMGTLLQRLGNVNMEKRECLKACTMIYNPVCISNGKYRTLAASPCTMDALNCALGIGEEQFRVLQNDTC